MSFFGKWRAESAPRKALVGREPRVRLLLADGARFKTVDSEYSVLNLSESGLAFFSESTVPHGRLAGTLRIGNAELTTEIEVVRQSGTNVGAKFSDRSVGALLRRQFSDELRATEMSEVTAPRSAEEGSGRPRWFYNTGNYELFFVEDAGRVTNLQMAWGNRVAMATPSRPLRVGSLTEENRAKPSHAMAQLVKWEDEVTAAERAKAIRLVENIPGVEAEWKSQIVALLRS